jgi:hypothetical protein
MSAADLATETRVLFERVAEAVKTSRAPVTMPQTPVIVLSIWRSVFGCDTSTGDAHLLRALAVIASRLARLDDQISGSALIDDNQKRVAHDVVQALVSWTKLDIFQRNVADFSGSIHPDRLALCGGSGFLDSGIS